MPNNHLTNQRNEQSFSENFLITSLIFLSFFPWIDLISFGFDSHPFISIFSLVYLLFVKKNIVIKKSEVIILSSFLIIAVLNLLFSFLKTESLFFEDIRGLYSIITISLAWFAFSNIIYIHNLKKVLIIINVIWVLTGLYEYFFSREIIDIFVSSRGTDSRGLSALSKEPSFFGLTLIFLSFCILIIDKYVFLKSWTFHTVNFFSIIFLSGSMTAIIPGVIFILLFFRPKRESRTLYFILVIFLIYIFYTIGLDDLYPRTRDLFLMMQNGLDELLTDASANARIEHLIIPWTVSFDNYFSPMLLSNFSEYRDSSVDTNIFWYFNNSKVILSWYLQFLYLLGLPFIVITLVVFFRKILTMKFLVIKSMFFLLLLILLPLPQTSGMPILTILLALSDRFYLNEIDEN